jgi:hypothetical protein
MSTPSTVMVLWSVGYAFDVPAPEAWRVGPAVIKTPAMATATSAATVSTPFDVLVSIVILLSGLSSRIVDVRVRWMK